MRAGAALGQQGDGSLRGTGAELRTDGYGAVRAGAGLLVSSYKITHGADARDPDGDNTAGMALLKQAVMLGETFSGAAKTHETVAYASHLGAAKADTSKPDDKAPPLKAMLTATSGTLSQHSVDAAKAEAPENRSRRETTSCRAPAAPSLPSPRKPDWACWPGKTCNWPTARPSP